MVVPVLMISCQVSEKWANGPLAAQTTTIETQAANVAGLPAPRATTLAAAVKTF